MPAWSRNPRYIVLILVAVVTTLYLLGPFGEPDARPPPPPPRVASSIQDDDLPNRLARSDKIYEKLLLDRKELIKKFGPTPNDVALFPPNKNPWPAYTVWDFFPAAYNCPFEIQRLGALGDGGKWVCGITRVETKPDCIVYSFGINYESSFEAEILANTDNCQIWGYDFSVNSFGPEIPRSQAHRTHFRPYGLAGTDAHGPDDVHKMYTIESLMKMNGHTHIDILKVDIERYEFETLTALIKPYVASGKPLPFGQLQLEIHLWDFSFSQFLTWWEMLEEAGLRPFWTEPNLVYQNYNRGGSTDLAEYSFLNIKGDNIFIKDPKRRPPPEAEHNRHAPDPTP
ncbi:methyltransferase domain-containing protein [Mycena albidolilacea]|uniref:Methyltransferase domain-containing protein n=1 Tax=Mycena albidolilacea TaxID=1033008 RepID=A0AAD7ARS5_9AGAR|nr:methyltransferase domain-containing protein [Mycena albidolilacea]